MNDELAKAFGVVGANRPALGIEFFSSFRQKLASRELLEALRKSGFDLSEPSGVVLEGLLVSGAVDPLKALQMYGALKEAQLASIKAQALQLDMLYKQTLMNWTQTQILAKQQSMMLQMSEAGQKFLEEFFKPREETLAQAEEELQSLLKGYQGVPNLEQAREIELRLKAVRTARRFLAEWKRRALFQFEQLTGQGVPPLQASNLAFLRSYETYVAQFNDANKELALMAETNRDILNGQDTAKYFVDILSQVFDPNFATAVYYGLKTASAGYLDERSVNPQELEDEGIGWETVATGAGVVGGSAWLVRKLVSMRKGKKSPEPSPMAKELREQIRRAKMEAEEKVRAETKKSEAKMKRSLVYETAKQVNQKYQLRNFFADMEKIIRNLEEKGTVEWKKSGGLSQKKFTQFKSRMDFRMTSNPRAIMPRAGAGGMFGVGLTITDLLMQILNEEPEEPQSLEERWMT